MNQGSTRRWIVGDVEIVRIVEILDETIDPSILFQDCTPAQVQRHPWLLPRFALPDGRIRMNFQAFAVRAGDRRVMVDTCVGNDKDRQHPLFHHLQTDFLARLAEAGFAPESIDTVLCTHLHLDHVGWNTRRVNDLWVPTFPNARYLFNRVEWDFIHALAGTPGAELEHLPDSLQPVHAAGLVDFVATDHQVAPGIRLMPTPGHTPGHVSLRIESRGRRALISGDVLHHPLQCAEPGIRTNFCADHDQSQQTRRALLQFCCDERYFLIGSHFCEPTGGWVVRADSNWKFEASEETRP